MATKSACVLITVGPPKNRSELSAEFELPIPPALVAVTINLKYLNGSDVGNIVAS